MTMPRPHAALIVDSDPKGLESLVYGFQGAGWRITACPAPETASLLVKASGAQIIVIASRTDHDKVNTLVRQLRSREAFRTLSVLLLGPEDLRAPMKKHGDVDLLPLPAFVRDVLTATQLLVGVAAAQKPGEEPCFEDAITAQGTLSLVRTMSSLARSGSLHLVRKGRHGEILFHEGEVTAAQVGQLQGMAAVQHLLVWGDGHLELRLRPVTRRGQLHQSAQAFLEEFDRFQRDYNHAIRAIGPASTVYTVNEDRLHRSTGVVPAEVTPVVRLCDGQRALCDVIDESPFRVLDTVRILGRLIELAVLNRRDPKPADESGERTPLDEFWATARITSVAQQQMPPEPTETPRAQSAQPPPAQPAAHPGNESTGPLEPKPRPQRQTLEIGTPSPLSVRGSGEHPSPATPTMRFGVPAPGKAAADAAVAKPGDPPRKKTPLPPGLSGVPKPSPAAGVPAVKPSPALGVPAIKPSPATGVSAVKPSPALDVPAIKPSPAAGVPVIKPGQTRSTQASGTFELPQGRRTQQHAAEPRRSVVIDTHLVSLVPAASTAPAPAPATDSSPSVRMTGEMQIAPSRKTARSVPAAARITVELDASLTTESPTTHRAAVPVATMAAAPAAPRITGEMQVAPSARSSRPTSKAGVAATFQIDPSLSTAAKAIPERPSEPTPPEQHPFGPHRPSGSFSAVESDFFEREADLYKEQKTESFADLDERGPNAGAKNRRPNRKQ